jgi:hypothetical protein
MADKLYANLSSKVFHLIKNFREGFHIKEDTSASLNGYSTYQSGFDDSYGFFLMDFKNGYYSFYLTISIFILLNISVFAVTLQYANSAWYVYLTSLYIICFPFMFLGLWSTGKKRKNILCRILVVMILLTSLLMSYFIFYKFYFYFLESLNSLYFNLHSY